MNDNLIDMNYDYSDDSDVIGIATDYSKNKKIYIVYNTDEYGYILWKEIMSSFEDAISYARKMYRGMTKTHKRYK